MNSVFTKKFYILSLTEVYNKRSITVSLQNESCLARTQEKCMVFIIRKCLFLDKIWLGSILAYFITIHVLVYS